MLKNLFLSLGGCLLALPLCAQNYMIEVSEQEEPMATRSKSSVCGMALSLVSFPLGMNMTGILLVYGTSPKAV